MGIPERPVGLSHDENRLWDELTGQIPLEVLKQCDGRLLRELCAVLACQRRMSAITAEDLTDPHAMQIYLDLVKVVTAFGPIFGLSPRDRASMNINDEPDDFADWMSE